MIAGRPKHKTRLAGWQPQRFAWEMHTTHQALTGCGRGGCAVCCCCACRSAAAPAACGLEFSAAGWLTASSRSSEAASKSARGCCRSSEVASPESAGLRSRCCSRCCSCAAAAACTSTAPTSSCCTAGIEKPPPAGWHIGDAGSEDSGCEAGPALASASFSLANRPPIFAVAGCGPLAGCCFCCCSAAASMSEASTAAAPCLRGCLLTLARLGWGDWLAFCLAAWLRVSTMFAASEGGEGENRKKGVAVGRGMSGPGSSEAFVSPDDTSRAYIGARSGRCCRWPTCLRIRLASGVDRRVLGKVSKAWMSIDKLQV